MSGQRDRHGSLRGVAVASHAAWREPAITSDEFRKLQALIRDETGIALDDDKNRFVESRLMRRLRELRLASFAAYHERATRPDPERAELQALINCITTNKTGFFREEHHFAFLRDVVFPSASPARLIRIWSAGCSTGQEPYTMAMAALEYFGAAAARRVRILATDIDTEVLATARHAIYPEAAASGIPVALRRHWLLRGKHRQNPMVRIHPDVRALVEFRPLNLMHPVWPIDDAFDVVFCRNVTIYFDPATRAALIDRMAQRLPAGGFLVLGHSELVPPEVRTLESLRHSVFRRRPVDGMRPAFTRDDARLAFDEASLPSTRIIAGGVFASAAPAIGRTLVGSCVTVCLYDPVARVGGLNHFMLPAGDLDGEAATRYGVQAMDALIDRIAALGGDRHRLDAKAFGAGSLLSGHGDRGRVGDRNADFVKRFLATNEIPLLAHRFGGTRALDVRFHTATGRAYVRPVAGGAERDTRHADARYAIDVRRQLRAYLVSP